MSPLSWVLIVSSTARPAARPGARRAGGAACRCGRHRQRLVEQEFQVKRGHAIRVSHDLGYRLGDQANREVRQHAAVDDGVAGDQARGRATPAWRARVDGPAAAGAASPPPDPRAIAPTAVPICSPIPRAAVGAHQAHGRPRPLRDPLAPRYRSRRRLRGGEGWAGVPRCRRRVQGPTDPRGARQTRGIQGSPEKGTIGLSSRRAPPSVPRARLCSWATWWRRPSRS